MRTLRCAVHRRLLASNPGRGRAHASTCLRCQAAESRYRAIQRELRRMRDDVEAAPDHLLAAVMEELDAPPPAHRAGGRKAAVAGGTAVAIAAAAAIAVRHRRVA